MNKKIMPSAVMMTVLAALSGCATTAYPDFNRILDSAIGKRNAQLHLPLDLPLKQYSDGGRTVIEYAYLRPHYCRWRFSYDKAGRITQWAYPDDTARSECTALAFHIR
ncbi:hypothetical protein [Duganella sp.]|uniref:hypothetical protein n=1 Tax=Duganella sp. TaxID=1904440 RepID=UPI0031DAF2FC